MKSKILLTIITTLVALNCDYGKNFNIAYSENNSNNLTYETDSLKTKKLDDLLNLLSENNKFMGSLTIRKESKILFNKAYGFSDIQNNKISSISTKYRIGSITKMFTSVMIFQLLETNKLTLETKLSKFFPEIPNSNIITISNLLNHRSGIHNFTNDEDYLNWNTKSISQSEMIKIMSKSIPEFKPNEKADYSNSNYVLLGYIIEKITNKDYSTNLKERITDKIGLKETYYGENVKKYSDESYSYNFKNKKWVEEHSTNMNIPHGAGAIVSTTNDLTLFITSLFNEKLVNKNSLNEITTIENGYGKGIFKMPFYEHISFGHTGEIDGFHSVLSYFPNDNLSIALTSNALNYDMNNISLAILSIYYDKGYKIPSFKKVNVSPEILKKYEGVYSSNQFPLKITIKLNNDELTAKATGQSEFTLNTVSETEFTFEIADILIKFISDKDQFVLTQRNKSFNFNKEKE